MNGLLSGLTPQTLIHSELFAQIGSVQLADLMVEADNSVRFSRTLLGRPPHGETELALVYAAILALGSDMTAADMARMVPPLSAEAIGVMMRRLVAQKSFRAANDVILVPSRGSPPHACGEMGFRLIRYDELRQADALAARCDPRRRTPSIGTYTHVPDQWPILYDRPILLNRRPAGAAIEGALHHPELDRIAVHTHGFTHFAMAIAKAAGLDLCPRLATLGERKPSKFWPLSFTVDTSARNFPAKWIRVGLRYDTARPLSSVTHIAACAAKCGSEFHRGQSRPQ